MAEDKEEGEVQVTSGGSSVEEGEFSVGLDSQISTIEDQLQRAQATLFELQELKAKLEIEKRENHKKERLEKEISEAEKIKKENKRLREELKDYHNEIGSLKEIIGSLKDNLVQTAEKLEKKVSRSLESLENDFEEIDNRHDSANYSHSKSSLQETKTVHPRHAHDIRKEEIRERNFFNDHLTKDKPSEVSADSKVETKTEAITVTKQSTETVKVNKNEDSLKKDENNQISQASEAPKESAPVESATFAQEPQASGEAVHPQSANASASAVNPQNTEPEAKPSSELGDFLKSDVATNPEGNVEAVITKIEAGQAQAEATAEELLDENFDEYEEIRKELEALEGESIFKNIIDKTNGSQIDASSKDNKSQTKPEVEKKTSKLFSGVLAKISAKKEALENQSDQKPTIQNQDANNQQPKQVAENQAEPIKEQQSAQVNEQVKQQQSSDAAVAVQETVANQTAIPQDQAKTEASSQAVASLGSEQIQETGHAEMSGDSQASEHEHKGLGNIKNIFRRKKPKVRGHVDDEGGSKFGAAGKLAVGAAVVVLIISGGIVSIKLKNAQALRELYTSRASEAIVEGNANSIASNTPDEFTNHNPEVKYKEAFVDLPFEDTAWVNYKDPEVGISIDYPKNTSYRLKPVGSNNLWFLRKNGYLLKIEKVETAQSLDDFAAEIKQNVSYEAEKLVIRGHSTIHLVLTEDLPVKGNIYLSEFEGGIYKIWYKTFQVDEEPADQKRVQRMLDSLAFVSPDE